MTYNLFFIPCYGPIIADNLYPCQQKEEQKLRVEKLQPWFSQSDADVVSYMNKSFELHPNMH